MSPPPKPPREVHPLPRVSRLSDARVVLRKGGGVHPLADLFHTMMTASWSTTVALVFASYLVSNLLFAVVYYAIEDSIANARVNNFEDAFFFSVQTMATIGYGAMSPKTSVANTVVSIEAIWGVIAAALVTGLVFAKFSRPTARLRFAHVAVLGTMNGARVLTIRLANERNSRLVEAVATLTLLWDEKTREGQPFRRMIDLPLQRERTPALAFSWSIFHAVDEASPLFGETPDSLATKRASFIVTIVGTEETLMQTVHARHAYDHDSIVFDAHFADAFTFSADGAVLDLDRIHAYVLEEERAPASGATTVSAPRSAP